MPKVKNSWSGSKIPEINFSGHGINVKQQEREYIFPPGLLVDTSNGIIQFKDEYANISIEDGQISVDNKKLDHIFEKNIKIKYEDILKLINLDS